MQPKPPQILILLAFALAYGAPAYGALSGDGAAHSAPSVELQQRVATIERLFGVSEFDSVLSLIPDALETAHASRDSTLIARLLIVRGRVELFTKTAQDAERSLEQARQIAEAARDTARWSDALGFKSIATTFQGKYKESIELNETRLELAKLIDDRVAEAWARTAMAYGRGRNTRRPPTYSAPKTGPEKNSHRWWGWEGH